MRAEVRRLFTKYPIRKVWVCDLRVPGLLLSLILYPISSASACSMEPSFWALCASPRYWWALCSPSLTIHP